MPIVLKRQHTSAYLLISAALLLLSAYVFDQQSDSYYYSVAKVLRVVDGDTIWVRGVYGYRAGVDFKVRFAAINAPEIDTPSGVLAARELNEMLFGRCVVIAVPKSDRRDKYGRTIGVVLLPGPSGFRNVDYTLVRMGLARAVDYGVPPEELLQNGTMVPGWVHEAVSRGC